MHPNTHVALIFFYRTCLGLSHLGQFVLSGAELLVQEAETVESVGAGLARV